MLPRLAPCHTNYRSLRKNRRNEQEAHCPAERGRKSGLSAGSNERRRPERISEPKSSKPHPAERTCGGTESAIHFEHFPTWLKGRRETRLGTPTRLQHEAGRKQPCFPPARNICPTPILQGQVLPRELHRSRNVEHDGDDRQRRIPDQEGYIHRRGAHRVDGVDVE